MLSPTGTLVPIGEDAQKRQLARLPFSTLSWIYTSIFCLRRKVAIPLLFLAVALGNLPDWLEAPYYIFLQNKVLRIKQGLWFLEWLTYKIYKLENVFHTKAQAPFGIYTQIAVVAFFLLLLH